jgi:hypothetical protein
MEEVPRFFLLVNIRDQHQPNIPFNELKEKYQNIVACDSFNIKSDKKKLNKFHQIAQKNGIDKNGREELQKTLHALGICLKYKEIEGFNTLVLNPDWISQGVYKIINWGHNEKKYKISLSDFDTIFLNNSRYSKDKHQYFFELMRFYELAYMTRDKESLIVPFLLKNDRPQKPTSLPH